MNILALISVLVCISFNVNSDFIGYNELNLIEENKPLKVKCLSHKISTNSNIKWYNVTLISTDPYDQSHSHILIDENNEFLTVGSDGQLYARRARPEHSGYYSCRVHHYGDGNGMKSGDTYRLHLIEVTKKPLISKLEENLVIEVFTDTESVDNQMIDGLIKDLVVNKQFVTRIHYNSEKTSCEFNSDLNLMKCQLNIKSEAKKKCHRGHCSSDQNTFEANVDKDLRELQTLLKSNDELFKQKLNTQSIDFEVRRRDANNLIDCPEGYYSHSNQCRPCHPGKYRNSKELNCRDCAVNTYNPFFGRPDCIACPQSSQTAAKGFEGFGEGSTHIHECKFFYGSGFTGPFLLFDDY